VEYEMINGVTQALRDVDVSRVVRNAGRAIIGTPPFVGQHALRQRYLKRRAVDVEQFSERQPALDMGQEAMRASQLQTRTEGCGPLVSRTYAVDIIEADLTAEALLERFVARPDDFVPRHITGFFVGDEPATDLTIGDELVVEIPGPWNGPVVVAYTSATSLLLATLDGHMEAGLIRFRTAQTGDSVVRFEIRSWARAGDEFFEQLHVNVRLGREAQTAMWVHTCDRAVAIAGGRRAGSISVSTETLQGSEGEC